MVTSDPQAVAWSVELRSSGRVCADVSRGRSLLYVAVGVLMTAMGVGLLVFGGVSGAVFGAILLVIAVPMVVMSTRQCLRVGSWRSPQVLLDADGLTVRHGYLRLPWSELYGAFAYTATHNRWITLTTSPESYDAWLRSRSPVLRLLGRRWRRRRWGSVNLPPNLAVDTVAFAAWLTDEARTRQLAEIERLRHELESAERRVAAQADELDAPQS